MGFFKKVDAFAGLARPTATTPTAICVKVRGAMLCFGTYVDSRQPRNYPFDFAGGGGVDHSLLQCVSDKGYSLKPEVKKTLSNWKLATDRNFFR